MSKKQVLSTFTILCCTTFIAILGHVQPAGSGLETSGRGYRPRFWKDLESSGSGRLGRRPPVDSMARMPPLERLNPGHFSSFKFSVENWVTQERMTHCQRLGPVALTGQKRGWNDGTSSSSVLNKWDRYLDFPSYQNYTLWGRGTSPKEIRVMVRRRKRYYELPQSQTASNHSRVQSRVSYFYCRIKKRHSVQLGLDSSKNGSRVVEFGQMTKLDVMKLCSCVCRHL